MDIYNYHPATGEYLGKTGARPDPLSDGDYLVPANATTVAPPKPEPGNVPRWTGDAWEIVRDHRGRQYYLPDGQHQKIDALGETLPDNALLTKPATVQRDEAIHRLDTAADRARAADRSVGQYLDAEYQLVARALADYRDNPDAEVPEAIRSHADAEGIGVEAAAQRIAEAAARADKRLQAVRRIRLAGKAAIRDAGDDADMMATARPYIDRLEALQAR